MTSGPIIDHEALRHLRTTGVLAFVAAAALASTGVILGPDRVGAPLLVAASVALVLGVGLRRRSRVARVMACVWSALWVPLFPIGTAFGLYALWVLTSRRTRALFHQREPMPKARAFGAIVAAQVSFAGCVVWALFVLSYLAWPMLAEAHRAQQLEQTAGTEPHP